MHVQRTQCCPLSLAPFFCSPLLCDVQLLVDVFLLPLERWAKELEAQREYAHDCSSDGASSRDKWAPDFNQEGVLFVYIILSAHVTYKHTTACRGERSAPGYLFYCLADP